MPIFSLTAWHLFSDANGYRCHALDKKTSGVLQNRRIGPKWRQSAQWLIEKPIPRLDGVLSRAADRASVNRIGSLQGHTPARQERRTKHRSQLSVRAD